MENAKIELYGKNSYANENLIVNYCVGPYRRDVPKFSHTHDEYEIVIPVNPFIMEIDSVKTIMEPTYSFLIASNVPHAFYKDYKNLGYIDIKWRKEYFEEVVKEICPLNEFHFVGKFKVTEELKVLLDQFMISVSVSSHSSKIKIEALVKYLTLQVIETIIDSQKKRSFVSFFQKDELRKVVDYINEYYAKDLSLAELAEIANLSVFHFSRKFKGHFGLSPMQYVRQIRLAKAMYYLRNTNLQVRVIAKMCGYSSQNQLNVAIRKMFKVTPLQVRRM